MTAKFRTIILLLLPIVWASSVRAQDSATQLKWGLMANIGGLTIDAADGSATFGLIPGVGIGAVYGNKNTGIDLSAHFLLNISYVAKEEKRPNAEGVEEEVDVSHWLVDTMVIGGVSFIHLGAGVRFQRDEAVHFIVMLSAGPNFTF